MMRRGDNADGGPRRFVRKWLRFDERRPLRSRLAWKFVAAVAMLLIASGLLALLGNSR